MMRRRDQARMPGRWKRGIECDSDLLSITDTRRRKDPMRLRPLFASLAAFVIAATAYSAVPNAECSKTEKLSCGEGISTREGCLQLDETRCKDIKKAFICSGVTRPTRICLSNDQGKECENIDSFPCGDVYSVDCAWDARAADGGKCIRLEEGERTFFESDCKVWLCQLGE
jgi:hypothetical protein